MEKTRWIVTTSHERPINDVVRDLRETGFAVREVLAEVLSITGQASDTVARQVESIPGVVAVMRDEVFDVGPPDAPVTW